MIGSYYVVEGPRARCAHLALVPSPRQAQYRLSDAAELLLAGTEVEVHELRGHDPHDRGAGDEPAPVEVVAEGRHRRLGDDRLVEVEEGRLVHW